VGDYGAKDDWTRVGTNPHLDTIAYNANYVSINKVRILSLYVKNNTYMAFC
jgi:hypothetical protein